MGATPEILSNILNRGCEAVKCSVQLGFVLPTPYELYNAVPALQMYVGSRESILAG